MKLSPGQLAEQLQQRGWDRDTAARLATIAYPFQVPAGIIDVLARHCDTAKDLEELCRAFDDEGDTAQLIA